MPSAPADSVFAALEPHLAAVQKPIQYVGGELNSVSKEWVSPELGEDGTVRWALMYPDAYEVGLPNQGLQILYEIVNERPDAVAERSYAPWTDLSALMRAERLPLFSVDTHRAAGEFDLIGFNLSSELIYTNLSEDEENKLRHAFGDE